MNAKSILFISQTKFHRDTKRVWKDLEKFFTDFNRPMPSDLRLAINEFQKCFVPSSKNLYPMPLELRYNIRDYVMGYQELKRAKQHYPIDILEEFKSLPEYLNMLYSKGNQGFGETRCTSSE